MIENILTETAIQTRDAACAWYYALSYEKNQDWNVFAKLLREQFPEADIDKAEALVELTGKYSHLPRELLSSVPYVPENEDCEIFRAILSVFAADLFVDTRAQSAPILQEALQRCERYMDSERKGQYRNIMQNFCTQRTRMLSAQKHWTFGVLFAMHFTEDKPHYNVARCVEYFPQVLIPMIPETCYEVQPDVKGFRENDDFNISTHHVLSEVRSFLSKVCEKIDEIDGHIAEASKKWRLERIGIVEITLLRIAVYRILFERNIKTKHAILEAVELSKCYGSTHSKNFVNGMLQQICLNNQIDV